MLKNSSLLKMWLIFLVVLSTCSAFSIELYAQSSSLSNFGFEKVQPKANSTQNSNSNTTNSTRLLPSANRVPINGNASSPLLERDINPQSRGAPLIDQNYLEQSIPEAISSAIVRQQVPASLATSVARYSLGDILRHTVGQHPSIVKARADYERTLSNSKVVRGDILPEIELFYTHNFSRPLGTYNESNRSNEREAQYGSRLRQNLNFGVYGYKLSASLRKADAERERFFDVQDQIALEAALSYVQTFRFYNKYQIGVDYINLLIRLDVKVRARNNAGYTNALEEKKLNVLRQRILAENEFNRRQYETALVFLSNVSNIPNLSVRTLKDFNFRIPTFAFSEAQIIERASNTNRGLLAANSSVEASENELSEAKASLGPSFDLDWEYFEQNYVDKEVNFNNRDVDTAVRFNVKYILWSGNKKINQIKAKQWELESNVAQFEILHLQLRNQIQSAYTGYTVALSELRHSEKARKEATELLRLQEQDFSLGVSTSLLDLINTTSEWYRSSGQEIDAYFEILNRYLQIKRLIGEILDNNI